VSESAVELVTVTVDGVDVKVPKGMNIIEVARLAGVEIPHYCYHPHLSIAGNCRMCQIAIEGQPKLAIGCNTTAAEGLKIKTQFSSPEVSEAQRATLEFLLINHPLDCTVCDQAGHCKLQDYYHEYNSTPSRFIEDKVNKVKAEPLGPEVIYDGERCIVCTRCSRFCDEISETSELGVFNRGDKSVIGIYPGKELDNPFSGTVVDLCPVGALTHRQWRFNTRIWYTEHVDSVCAGCSTGCNVKVFQRDNQIVQVKARLNGEVNKEWLCDEGRYGFNRFQAKTEERLTDPVESSSNSSKRISWKDVANKLQGLKSAKNSPQENALFLSPLLTLEEMYLALQFGEKFLGLKAEDSNVAIQLVTRSLTPLESKLISPDFAPNARAGALLGMIAIAENNWREQLENRYKALLKSLKEGNLKRVILVGDQAICSEDFTDIMSALNKCEISIALASNLNAGPLLTLPGRTSNEKSGLYINRDLRIQRVKASLTAPSGSLPEWMILQRMSEALGGALLAKDISDERALTRYVLSKLERTKDVTIQKLGESGVQVVGGV
jgi:NADH-quinone oxidoreductase subunit G